MEGISYLKERFHKIRADGSITPRRVITAMVLTLSLYIGTVMMSFGMNFWLWSFPKGLKRSYVSIVVPSLIWVALFVFTFMVTAIVDRIRTGKFDNYLFWVEKKGILLLFCIGLFDSLTGLTGMYAVIHIPQILQSALISTGPLWTFFLACILYPASQPPFHPILILVFILTAAGVTLALLPQVLYNTDPSRPFHAGWTVIYLAATALFPLYNVLQGRFLSEYRDFCSPFSRKIVMLTVETSIQLVLTFGYFPADFAPFYGKCDSAQESWDNLMESLRFIGSDRNNAIYMMIYVMGFWIRHVVFAYLNTYSPSVAAVTSMLTQPINAFLLLVIPAWNVYGTKKDWRFTLGCFFCLLFAMFFFIFWHLAYKVPHADRIANATDSNAAVEPIPATTSELLSKREPLSPFSSAEELDAAYVAVRDEENTRDPVAVENKN